MHSLSRMCLVIAFLAFLAFPAISPESRADLFGPDNFDECITESMKGVTSDVAARAIYKSCKAQFADDEKAKSRPLTYEQRNLLTGQAALEGGMENPLLPGSYMLHDRFAGYIYNGNPDITVTEMTISLTPKGIEDTEERLHLIAISLKPLSRSDFSFEHVQVDDADGYSWTISSAKGYVSE